MVAFFKKHSVGITLIILLIATAILVTTFVVNGSEYEDAWFYIIAFLIIFLPAFDLYSKWKNKGKKKTKGR